MKQTIEVWIDESGNFEDNSISESASLIGGVIVKKTKFTADEAKNLIAPYKKLHSNKLDRNEFKNLIHSFLTRLENKPIEPFVIENKERLNLFDSRSTYFTIFAEGMMQLINNLYLSNPDASIILNIARRMYPDSKQTLIAEKDEDYIRRLTERIGWLTLTNRNYAKISPRNITIKIGSAQDDPQLMVADLVCHAWFRRYSKLTSADARTLGDIVEPNYFTVVETERLASVKNKIHLGQYGESLYDIIGQLALNECEPKRIDLLINQAIQGLKRVNRSELQYQLNTLAFDVKALVNYDREFETAQTYCSLLKAKIIPALEEANLPVEKLHAEINLSLFTAVQHQGKLQLAAQQLKILEEAIRVLSTEWENFTLLIEIYVRKATYLNMIYAFQEAIQLTGKLLDILEGYTELTSSFLQENFDESITMSQSLDVGKLYGIKSQAELAIGLSKSESLQNAHSSALKAIHNFNSASDRERHYQTLCQIEILKKNYKQAECYLLSSVFGTAEGLTKLAVENFAAVVEQKSGVSRNYLYYHYLTLLVQASRNQASEQLCFSFEDIRNYLLIERLSADKYPDILVLEQFAANQLYQGETKSALEKFERILSVNLNVEKPQMIQLLGIRIFSTALFHLKETRNENKSFYKKYRASALKVLAKFSTEVPELKTLVKALETELVQHPHLAHFPDQAFYQKAAIIQ